MYKLLCCPSPPPAAAHVAAHQDNSELWHLRLGHVAHDSIRRLQDEQMVTGLELRREKQQRSEHLSPCAACLQGKQHSARISSDAHATRATQPMELVHTDVVGPMNTLSVDGYRYYIGFVDDFVALKVIRTLLTCPLALITFPHSPFSGCPRPF